MYTRGTSRILDRGGEPYSIQPESGVALFSELGTKYTDGPVEVSGVGLMARCPTSGLWVPHEYVRPGTTWRLANAANSWFDTTSLVQAQSLNLASFKTGWATSVTGTGTVTGGWVAGPASTPILSRAPIGSTASLTYTITGRTATEKMAVVIDMQGVVGAVTGSASNYVNVIVGDAQRNKKCALMMARDLTPVAGYYSGSGASELLTAVETRETWSLVHTAAPRAMACVLSDDTVSPWQVCKGWAATAATDFVQFQVYHVATAGNIDLTVYSVAIYLGGV
jgi:hypothetical protein